MTATIQTPPPAYADHTTPDGTPVRHPNGRTGVIDGRHEIDGHRTVRVRYDVPVRSPFGGEHGHGYAEVGTARILAPGEARQTSDDEALWGELDAITARPGVCGPPLTHQQHNAAARYLADRYGSSPTFHGDPQEAFRYYAVSSTWDVINAFRFARTRATD